MEIFELRAKRFAGIGWELGLVDGVDGIGLIGPLTEAPSTNLSV